MPYLSKIPLNPHRRTASSLLGNPHRMHATLLAGLAVQPVTERVLWRLESDTAHRCEVLVLTESRPAWDHLVEQAGWPDADGGNSLIADYTPLLQRIALGREYAFRLTANPVQSVRRPQKPSDTQAALLDKHDANPGTAAQRGARGFRVPHRTAPHQLQWLLDRTERCGFTIPPPPTPAPAPGLTHDTPTTSAPAVTMTSRDVLRFRKHPNGPHVTLATATYQGRLCVTDTDALRATLLNGIGPAKGYGQGLLTLAPLPADTPHA